MSELLTMAVEDLQRRARVLERIVGRLQHVESFTLYFIVSEYGARGDGAADDRLAIDAAISAAHAAGGGVVFFPPGEYIASKNSTVGYRGCIVLDGVANVHLMGSGQDVTIIKRLGVELTADTHVIDMIACNNVTISDLTVNGNRDGSTFSGDQHHNIYVRATGGDSANITITRVHTTNSVGVGIYLAGNLSTDNYYTRNTLVEDCRITDTGTSGIAHQRALIGVKERYNYFEGVNDTEFDYEPSGSTLPSPEDILIEGNIIYHATPALAIQLGGISEDRPIRKARVINNIIIDGSISVGDSEDVVVESNYIYGDALENNPVFNVRRYVRNLRICKNTLVNNNTGSDQAAVRFVRASSFSPEDVVISNNDLINNVESTGSDAQHGIYMDSCQKFTIEGNRLVGNGGSSGRGIRIINTALNPALDIVIKGNSIRNFGGRGIQISAATPASFPFNTVTIEGNHFYDDQGTPTQTTGIEIGSTTGLLVTGQSLTIANNNFGVGITSAVVNTAGTAQYWSIGGGGGGTLAVGIYTGTGTPEANVTAPIGSLYLRRDGGATTSLYVKESGTGNTGWVAK